MQEGRAAGAAMQGAAAGVTREALGWLIRQLPTPAALFDRELRYLAYSPAWLRQYRLADADLVGRGHYEVFPEVPESWKEIHRRCLAGAIHTRDLDAFERADGRTDYLRWVVAPWRDEAGEIGGLVMLTEVLTERVATRRRLEEREDFIRSLFERSPIGLNLSRTDGLWIESNPAFLDIIGYSREEADGNLTYWDLTPARYEADERRQLESLETTGRYGPYEKEFIRKDGSRVPVRLNGFLIEREGSRYIWSMVEDVTERRRLEQEVEAERLKAIQASKLAQLGEMAAGFAHEINNPLAIVDGYAGALREIAASGDPALLEEAVEAIQGAVRRASRIVGGLRKFAREDDGTDLQTLPVADLLEEALDLCAARIRNLGIELRLDDAPRGSVRCSSIELTQVLVNLLNNAADAAHRSSGGWIAVETRRADGQVEIRVRDTGPGIADDARERIFAPFYTTKRVGEGTGLGLSISKGIVERLGGSLFLDPEADHTTFVVSLPEVTS